MEGEKGYGFSIDSCRLTAVCYADDILLAASTKEHLEAMIADVVENLRLIGLGVGAERGVKSSGRRNALGSILGRRRCSWFSSTSALLAIVARSNTNVQCNYRVPLSETTHDKDCLLKQCTEGVSARSLFVIAQRAMTQMTGYFGGYISTRKKVRAL